MNARKIVNPAMTTKDAMTYRPNLISHHDSSVENGRLTPGPATSELAVIITEQS